MNAPADEIRQLAAEIPLDYVQLHGDEPPDVIAELAPLPVIKAFRIPDASMQPVAEFLAGGGLGANLKAVLLDAYSTSAYGGTGQTLDWESLGNSDKIPTELPIILAGGLTPDNVAQAIRVARPQAVDTASGVESSPGVKDAIKVRKFVENAKRAFGL